jgi:hypothetical protein
MMPSAGRPQTEPPSRAPLRHPAEIPFFAFMVVLNVAIIALIINLAVVLPFLPDALRETPVALAIRCAAPRSSSPRASSPTCTGPRTTSPAGSACAAGRRSS